jgi:serine phosphatase RsbU (regulator of sigma subunit)
VVIDDSMLRRPAEGVRSSVSRRHAIICCVGGSYYIEDGDGQRGGSRNGTFVNDQKVPYPERLRLHHNDRIRICDFRCAFHDGREAELTVEASLDHQSSTQSLQAQPAERLRVILEISNSLSRALDIDALLPRLVDHLFQLFGQADRAFILLGNGATEPVVVRAFKSRCPEEEADARFSASIVRRCLDNVQAILGNDLAEQFPDCESINALPIRSLLCAPLWSQDGQALGAIQLDTQGPRGRFSQDDLTLLLGVASQASIALCNARLHQEALLHQRRQRDLEVAREVQLALLPQRLPDVPGYAFFAHYEAALTIGGDYYDFIPLPQQRLAILLGDVAGKGVPAALVMARFSVEARVCLQDQADLAAAVSKLNSLLARAGLLDRFVTLVAVVLDPPTHTATLVNAGHPAPLLCRASTGEVDEALPLALAGEPIGITAGYTYASGAVPLQPGDSLVLFSDGLTDALDAQGRPFRTRGVRAVLQGRKSSPRENGERLLQAVKRHAAGCSQNDDITLVCFGRAGHG